MTKYREIIRLTGLGFSQRDIMQAVVLRKKLSSKFRNVPENYHFHGHLMKQ